MAIDGRPDQQHRIHRHHRCIEVDAEADKDSIEKIALAEENVQRFIEDKTVRKVIVVPGKLINIVVGG